MYTFRVSTQEVEEGPSVEVHEEFNQEPWESQPQEEVVEKSEKVGLVSKPICVHVILTVISLINV